MFQDEHHDGQQNDEDYDATRPELRQSVREIRGDSVEYEAGRKKGHGHQQSAAKG